MLIRQNGIFTQILNTPNLCSHLSMQPKYLMEIFTRLLLHESLPCRSISEPMCEGVITNALQSCSQGIFMLLTPGRDKHIYYIPRIRANSISHRAT